jgi:glutaredoxin-related protein
MADPELKSKIEELIAANPVLLFMKGTPDMPRCGFSMRVVQVLDQVDVDYGAIDVLPALQPLREVTAEISDWQTFPQLYVMASCSAAATSSRRCSSPANSPQPLASSSLRTLRFRQRRQLSHPRCRSNSSRRLTKQIKDAGSVACSARERLRTPRCAGQTVAAASSFT